MTFIKVFNRRIYYSEIAFFMVILLLFVSVLFFYAEIKSLASYVIGTYGLIGLFILTIIMDFVIQPISPDLLVFGSTFAGQNLLWASLVGGLGSVVAGSLAYLAGYYIGQEGFVKWFGDNHLKNGEKLFNRYGVFAVVVGALSPVPYSAICWSAGIFKMDYITFLLTSILTRLPRFFILGFIGYLL